ncbi:zeta toxin family protein [Dactylosporangium sp. NPDC005555]|uniref:zeta toxin family protein n=1 Tax=Dactylosporangium sp. NPDC005555 TaxID=3154889 RepID=UPI0033B7DA69
MTHPIDPRRYLLSDADSHRIVTDEIVPEQLVHGVPQTEPVVVFVAGQPGAGKTMTTRMVERRLGIVDCYLSQVQHQDRPPDRPR